MPLSWKSTHNDEIKNLSEANGMKVQVTDKRFSLKKKRKNAKNYILLVNLLWKCPNTQASEP